MAIAAILSIVLVSVPLGLLHALDIDHLTTISSLSARPGGHRASLRYAFWWAAGHGGFLMAMAIATIVLKWSVPLLLPTLAERFVGVIMVVAGLSMLWALWRQHGFAPAHRHRIGMRAKLPVLVGMVHGMAGSAGVLALVPLTLYQPAVAIAYVALFSFGVLTGMMSFGYALDKVQSKVADRLPAALRCARAFIGVGAIGIGAYWVQAIG